MKSTLIAFAMLLIVAPGVCAYENEPFARCGIHYSPGICCGGHPLIIMGVYGSKAAAQAAAQSYYNENSYYQGLQST
jgi:hypothetical protein